MYLFISVNGYVIFYSDLLTADQFCSIQSTSIISITMGERYRGIFVANKIYDKLIVFGDK